MITREIARDGIQKWLDDLGVQNGGWVIVDSMTIERPYGWMFFRATREYLETKKICAIPPGNSGMLCLKDSGKFLFVGTAAPSADYLAQYEKDPIGFLQRFTFVSTGADAG